MFTTGLGLSASFCWGLSDFLGGQQARRISVLVVLVGSQFVGLCVFATVLLTTGPGGLPHGSLVLTAALAGLTGAIGLASFYRALAVGSMSMVAPIVATGAVVPVLAGVVRGDDLGPVSATGVVLAILGVVLASRAGVGREDVRVASRESSATATVLAVTAALSIGASLVFLDVSAQHSVAWTLAISRVASASAGLGVLLIVRPAVPRSPRHLLPVFGVGALEASATGFYTLATTKGLLSLTAVASSLYPVVTVLLARAFLHERLNRDQACGVVAVLAGVVLMAAG